MKDACLRKDSKQRSEPQISMVWVISIDGKSKPCFEDVSVMFILHSLSNRQNLSGKTGKLMPFPLASAVGMSFLFNVHLDQGSNMQVQKEL